MFSEYSVKCGKLYFLNSRDAEIKIEQREFDEPEWQGRAYQCSKCGKWHIATANKQQIEEQELAKLRQKEHDEKRQNAREEKSEQQRLQQKAQADYHKAKAVRELIEDLDRREGKSSSKSKNRKSHNHSPERTIDGSRIVESFGDDEKSSGNTVLGSLDEETLRSLGLL